MIKRTLTLLLLITSISLQAARYTTNIPVKNGEKWWGIFVGGDMKQPFITSFNTAENPNQSAEQTSTLLISNTGRYIWSKHPADIYFDGTVFIITSDYEDIQVQRGGRNLREAYLVCCHKNFPPNGEIPSGKELMTRPIYDLSLELGFNSSQDSVLDFARKIVDAGLPTGTIIIDEGWQSPSEVAVFDNDYFSDPATMVDQLHSMGFKVVLNVTPLIGAYGRNYEKALHDKDLLLNGKKKPLIVRSNGGYAACYDLSNDEIVDYFAGRLKSLKEKNKVDGYKLDCSNVTTSMTDQAQKTKFIANWNRLANMSEGNILFSKGSADGIRIATIDTEGMDGYAALRKLVEDAVVSPLAGAGMRVPTISSSVIEDNADELFRLRAMQLLAAMPVGLVYSFAWNFDDPQLRARAKEVLEFRKSIKGYVGECIDESARSAEPLIRSLAYQFPRNGFTDCYDQFVLGSRYLIAPVLDEAKERLVRFPKGEWKSPDGKSYKGPLVKSFDVSDGRMLYFELMSK